MGQQWSWALMASFFEGDADRMIGVSKACGTNAFEYSWRTASQQSREELVAVRERLEAEGVHVNSYHLPFTSGDDIASFYTVERQRAVDRMKEHIELAGLLGAKIVIQHPTTKPFPVGADDVKQYVEHMILSLEELVPAAKDAGVLIGLENMTPGGERARFFSESEHIRVFNEHFADPQVGFVYDTGHALMSGPEEARAILEEMGDKIVGWHLSDNAGDRDSHLAPGRGEVDWAMVFQFASDVNFDAPMTIETPPWGPGPDYSMETWRATVQYLNELAANVTT